MNGMVAIVLEVNHRFKHLPRVIVVQDMKGEFSREHVISLADIESDKLPKTHLIQRVLRDGEYGVYIKNYREKGLIFGQALR